MATGTKQFTRGQFAFNAVMTTLFFPALILLLAGDWLWLEGWLFSLWMVVMIVFNMTYLYLKDPALLVERAKSPGAQNQKRWDKILLPAMLLTAVIWLILMPLDAKRFEWSPAFPLWLKILGGIALLPSLYLIERATIDNTFLSTMVRIQNERKQRVISTGVYGFVRHPLYLGCALLMLGAPLMLGSLYGLAISLIAMMVLVGRILGEEKMLVQELEGYEDYKKKVRYRLIPFLW